MDNKYYTPTIEEFHIGFEFELLMDASLHTEDGNTLYWCFCSWTKQKVTEHLFNNNEIMKRLIKKGLIRKEINDTNKEPIS